MSTYKNYFTKILTYDGIMNSALISCSAGSVTGSDYKRNYSDIESVYHYISGAFKVPDDKIATETEYLVTTLSNGKDLYYKHGSNNHPSLYTYDENHNMVYFWDAYTNFSARNNLTFIIVRSDDATGSFGEYGIYVYSQYQNSEFYMMWNVSATNMPQWQYLLEGVPVDLDDPYITAPDSDIGGGFGDFDYSGDSVLPPDLPTISVADTGFVNLFAPTLGQLQSLASYMWSGLFDISNFRKLFADPMDCIISLNILPCDLPEGAPKELKVGNIGTGQNINNLVDQFIKISFAKQKIKVHTNSFMDYSPYVKAQIFLPFIGARSISIDEIADAFVSIEYHIDLFSGACTAYITIERTNSDGSSLNSSLYQFNGNVCANVPFTATNYSGFLGSLLSTATAVTTAIATQGSSSAVAGALSSGIDTATAIKPDVERSGNMSATNGFLGIQKPFLIITFPHVCKPDNRDKTVGTPSFIGLGSSKPLSSFHGLTRLHKINVKGIPCTENERQMIETALTGEGVIMP